MEMKLEFVNDDERYVNVANIRVPGIYGTKGDPLPARMAKLVRPAAEALQRVYRDVAAEGGHLYISDMFRSADEQQRAHEDWKAGRKTAFSPPSCGSVHEAARAIDIDAFDTGIGHRRVREILNQHGWTHIVETLTGAECWHYEFREERWEAFKRQHGYSAMARAMKEEIGNTASLAQAEIAEEGVRWLQTALNTLIAAGLVVDGAYGEKTREAVRRFQAQNRLQVDGVAGPITRSKIRALLGE
jgi:hypothetical protein